MVVKVSYSITRKIYWRWQWNVSLDGNPYVFGSTWTKRGAYKYVFRANTMLVESLSLIRVSNESN